MIRQAVYWTEYTPVISLTAYAVGDQLGGVQSLQLPTCGNQSVRLLDIIVTDKAKQNAKIDFFFFSADPAQTSADNDPLAVPSTSNTISFGCTRILDCDYCDPGGYSVASLGGILRGIQPNSSGKIWILTSIQEAKTYAAVDDLHFKLNFAVDYG